MIDPTLSQYITTQRTLGYSDEQLATSLQEAGWSDAVIAEALHPPETHSRINKKIIFIVLVIVLIGVIGGGTIWALQRNRQSARNTVINTPTNPISSQPQSQLYLTYISDIRTDITNPTATPKFVDLSTLTEVAFPELQQQEHTIAQVGDWSPDGAYIPITVTGAAHNEDRSTRLYWFNAKTKQLNPGPTSFDNPQINYDTFSYYNWLDTSRLILRQDRSESSVTLKLLSLDGTFSSQQFPFTESKEKNGDFVVQYSLTNQETAPLVMLNNGKTVSLPVGDRAVGLIPGYVLSFKEARSDININNPEAMEAAGLEIEKRIAEGATEEELRALTLNLIQPKVDSTITLTSTETTESLTFPIPADGMQTNSVLLHPNKKWLVAYQSSGESERYVSFDLSQSLQSPPREVLFENTIAGNNELQMYSIMTEGNAFSITNDGKYLVSIITDPATLGAGSINLYDFATKQNITICTNCSNPEVFNSQELISTY